MILGGTLPASTGRPRKVGPREVVVELTIDTSRFESAINRVVRQMLRLDFEVDARGLTEHQVDALMYVRGAFHPDFASDDSRDNYLRAIACHPRVGTVAAAAFLRGWFTHRPDADAPIDAFAWHRYFASSNGPGVICRVSAA